MSTQFTRGRGLGLLTCLCFASLCAFGLLLSVASGTGKIEAEWTSGDVLGARPITPTLEARLFLPLIDRDQCTPTSVPDDASLFGVVFFDYNGDGTRQPSEPGIKEAWVSAGGQSVTTGCDGVFFFRGLPAAAYDVTISADGFRYLSLSVSEFRSASAPIRVTTGEHTQHDFGLMQGFLTLPYHRETPYSIVEYFDYDPGYGQYLWWNGQHGSGISRNHVGTDLRVSANGIPVVAPAPGKVIWLGVDPNGGWGIDAQAPEGTIWGVFHVTPTVSLHQAVNRGDLIGYVNFPGAPHVHLDVKLFKADGHLYFRDIYVPFDPGICAEWRFVPGGEVEYVKTNCSPGYWTAKNSPQPFD